MQLELRRLHKILKLTFLLITHDQKEALLLSDKVVVLRGGKIEQQGSPSDVYDSPINEEVTDRGIVLATYQSYIDDEIVLKAGKEFDLQTIYFENDKEIFSGFQTGTYDLAIMSSSTLEEAIEKKLVKPIQWSKLKSIPSKYIEGSFPESQDNKKYFKDTLFSPIVNQIFQKNLDIHRYGIPYFLSFLIFAYRGDEIKVDNFSHGGMIEDELTIYSLSKLIRAEDSEELFKNWKNSEINFYEAYKDLKPLSQRQSIFLSTDSAVLTEMISDGSLKGAFLYNGDALAAYEEMKENSNSSELKFLEGSPSL
ncbi:hypothetical protein PVNG_02358 [Plasmodium vivax North Korean]|uniref:Uncharacterized protein n=1 Tax=Plasmodium vivax North Korean TaxID=1035514 RepID=A0A0J9TKG8_PLAVI|nr:hypothetical protein PVNG_02358 [Plasmodium vivax North Korean]